MSAPANDLAIEKSGETWTCRGCNSAVSTPHCPSCGERPLRPRDLTLRGLLMQIAQGFSDFDSRLIRSLRLLVTQPGALTVAYRLGPRKPYVMPFQLFLFANVLFFATQSLTGTKIFSTPLVAHFQSDIWGSLAHQWVGHHLEAIGTTLEAYAPLFDQAVALHAKSLIILMVFAFALLPPIVFFTSRTPFVVHVVFALHLYAFVQLLFCAALLLAEIDLWLGGGGLASPTVDHTLSLGLLAVCAAYLYGATGRVYASRGLARILGVAVLTVAVGAIVLGYRFVLLPITLLST